MKRLTIGLRACTETLAAMISVAWADGKLQDREKEGLRGAARVLNLAGDLRARLDAVLEKPAKVAELKLAGLADREKAFAYVAAAWIARADAGGDEHESAVLSELGAALGLDADRQAELSGIAADLAPPAGDVDYGEQVRSLFLAIPPRLETEEDDFEVAFE